MPRILVVDDEPQVRRAVRRSLEQADARTAVVDVGTGQEALDLAASWGPELVVLDLGLPDLDGVEVVRTLRTWTSAPVLILSGHDDETRKVRALDAGADDYLTKPFGLAELAARVRALGRRGVEPGRAEPLRLEGGLVVDLAARRVTRDGEEVRLTPTEWQLLAVLSAHPGRLLTHGALAERVWGAGYGDETRQALRTHLRGLRAKLGDPAHEPHLIRTESGSGYRWVAREAARPSVPAAEAPDAPDTPDDAPRPAPRAGDGQGRLAHDLANAVTALRLTLHLVEAQVPEAGPAARAHLRRAAHLADRVTDLARAITAGGHPTADHATADRPGEA